MGDDGTNGGNGVFAHKRAFVGQEETITNGAQVTFEIEVEENTGKPKARTWQITAGGAVPGAAVPGLDMSMLASLSAAYGAAAAAPLGMPLLGASPYGMTSLPTFPSMPTGLPAGWETTADPATGKPYYFNRA